MKFSTKEDVAAPIEEVFKALSDFESFERQAMRRGAEVQRVDDGKGLCEGATWKVAFSMRGRRRNLDLMLDRFEAPNEMLFVAKSQGMDAVFTIELLALSRSRTRMAVALEMTPLNLAARLLIQSLKLAKTNLTKRFKLRVADYAKQIEDRLGQA
ncbi:MAG: SRPBCC family protein [Pseudomonadota bacterium]